MEASVPLADAVTFCGASTVSKADRMRQPLLALAVRGIVLALLHVASCARLPNLRRCAQAYDAP